MKTWIEEQELRDRLTREALDEARRGIGAAISGCWRGPKPAQDAMKRKGGER
jgi:hypothetical protein